MTNFVQTWAKVESLELKNPLAQLGSFLRAQPNTGVDRESATAHAYRGVDAASVKARNGGVAPCA